MRTPSSDSAERALLEALRQSSHGIALTRVGESDPVLWANDAFERLLGDALKDVHHLLASPHRAPSQHPLPAAEGRHDGPTLSIQPLRGELESYALVVVAPAPATRPPPPSLDPLTGLPLRDALPSAFAHARAASGHLGVLYLDLDGFKTVNDVGGHAAGDRALSDLARSLRRALRPQDVLARVGGDELVALLPHLAAPRDATSVAERLLRIASDHSLSLSVGIAICATQGEDLDELLSRADAALYRSKAEGGGRCTLWRPELLAPTTGPRSR
ncbi:MAG: GGDEF domain-containing protein [Deltaproteobacteria bacterium]|nr:MAG: GGDEF domain-containing protein [Deltaproteobacteria bacterium]